jgi:hypothetical protein
MSNPAPRHPALHAAESFFAAPRFTHALATTAIAVSVLATAIRPLIGWAGLIGIVGVLVLFGGASLYARRESIEWQHLVPISLLVFVGWAAVSVFWSQYQWATVGGVAYLLAFSALGLYIALVRDTIQIVRAFGDVLRFVLVASMSRPEKISRSSPVCSSTRRSGSSASRRTSPRADRSRACSAPATSWVSSR